jgi:thiamine biosynthesis lipoprotein ApbE
MSPTTTRRRVLTSLVGLAAGAVLVPEIGGLLSSRQALNKTTLRHIPALGTRVSFLVRHPDSRLAEHGIRLAVRKIFEVHESMTLHGPSPLTWLNSCASDSYVDVPRSLLEVAQASRDLHRATGGLFDATQGRMRPENRGVAPGWDAVSLDT